ncbi:MAG: tetratricopeptide repeat protein [Candidatus Binatia bacterium]
MSIIEKKSTALELSEAAPDTENLLLARLQSSTTAEDYFRWLLFVVGFYRGINKVGAAMELLDRFIKESNDVEQSAHGYLALGQIATDAGRHDSALECFTSALQLAPKRHNVAYVLQNNIGYSLNSLGRFVDAEKHCRMAIDIDCKRASGYRNLGVSLHGQSHVVEAAWAFAEAVKVDSSDNRARILLEKLLALHPSLAVQCPWIVQILCFDQDAPVDAPLM